MIKPVIFVVASGTCGHIFPALAVADTLSSYYEIIWIGTNNGIEAKHVQYKIHQIKFAGFRKKSILQQFIVIKSLFSAITQSLQLIKAYHPVGVISFGGYVSIPMGIAAKIKKIPLIIHEQNSVAGLSNKILHLWSAQTLTAYKNVLASSKTQVVGNPLRKEFSQNFSDFHKSDNSSKIKILIIGGSLGAKYFNEHLPAVLNRLSNICSVLHQIGRNSKVNEVLSRYDLSRTDFKVQVVEFIDDVLQAYAAADFVICRAGALTVAEISCVGIPALFIPLPSAVDDHQFSNTKSLVEANAAFVVRQDEDTDNKVFKILQSLSQQQCNLMSTNDINRHNNLYCVNNIAKIVREYF
jgi:UDP-N-acetylglucosamine--N-acetylmuramyl-(pentapeptide) pyrophosphoryl-undecaprenol N-acetylglucosamine transferase